MGLIEAMTVLGRCGYERVETVLQLDGREGTKASSFGILTLIEENRVEGSRFTAPRVAVSECLRSQSPMVHVAPGADDQQYLPV